MTASFALIATAIALAALAGTPLLFSRVPTPGGQKMSALFHVAASLCGLIGALQTIMRERSDCYTLNWSLPFGPAEVGVDPLGAWFLLPVFLVSACSAVYALGYWPAADHPVTTGRLTFSFALLTATVALIVIARHGVFFLLAWEIMALACYFAMTVEDKKAAVQEAGLLYLITAHLGALALFALFALLQRTTGSFAFPAPGSLAAGNLVASGIFVTALVGFGLKAGLVPLHIWLPAAHANAPSHVSAFMSGVLIKMGIYGLLRTLSFFGQPPLWWGVCILVLGVVSGVVGVAFALGQHDIKRLLAYHSIENIGIIALGIGLALIGLSTGQQPLAMLGLAGALLHVLNHALFKSLLFLGAGSVIHACHTREIDQLGGLGQRLPRTALSFLVGAVAICGLPPLNGFVSEFFIYLGLFRGIIGGSGPALPLLALAAPALALIGALAVACFVKVYGSAFLGTPRSTTAAEAREAGPTMTGPMAAIALLCALIGLAPPLVAPLLEKAVFACHPDLAFTAPRLTQVAPLGWLAAGALALVASCGLLAVLYRRRLARNGAASAATWGCGYQATTPRMQYSSSSFAEMLVKLLGGLLRPHEQRPAIQGPFPRPTSFSSHVPEVVLELGYLPLLHRLNERLAVLRKLQHGQLHLYILYIVLTLVLLLTWSHYAVQP
jgi:hydrogenase-4 component B